MQPTYPKTTIRGMRSHREAIAAAIDADVLRTPAVPAGLPDSGAERDYVVARVRELFSIYRSHGVEPVSAFVSCAPSLADAIGSLTSVDGLDVTVFADPNGSDVEAGTFSVDVDADHPAAVFVRPAVGVAFSGPVTEAALHTRWVLQEIDGMAADDAARAADLL